MARKWGPFEKRQHYPRAIVPNIWELVENVLGKLLLRHTFASLAFPPSSSFLFSPLRDAPQTCNRHNTVQNASKLAAFPARRLASAAEQLVITLGHSAASCAVRLRGFWWLWDNNPGNGPLHEGVGPPPPFLWAPFSLYATQEDAGKGHGGGIRSERTQRR